MSESEDFEAAASTGHVEINAHRWRFSLRTLLVFNTCVAAVIAIVANYPLVALFLAGIVSTLIFLQVAVFFATLAVLGFGRVWHSFDTEPASEVAAIADER
jgi:hypothetical protein